MVDHNMYCEAWNKFNLLKGKKADLENFDQLDDIYNLVSFFYKAGLSLNGDYEFKKGPSKLVNFLLKNKKIVSKAIRIYIEIAQEDMAEVIESKRWLGEAFPKTGCQCQDDAQEALYELRLLESVKHWFEETEQATPEVFTEYLHQVQRIVKEKQKE